MCHFLSLVPGVVVQDDNHIMGRLQMYLMCMLKIDIIVNTSSLLQSCGISDFVLLLIVNQA